MSRSVTKAEVRILRGCAYLGLFTDTILHSPWMLSTSYSCPVTQYDFIYLRFGINVIRAQMTGGIVHMPGGRLDTLWPLEHLWVVLSTSFNIRLFPGKWPCPSRQLDLQGCDSDIFSSEDLQGCDSDVFSSRSALRRIWSGLLLLDGFLLH